MKKVILCDLQDIKTESDVEQKFILPILIEPSPTGLNYVMSDFRTKPDIRGYYINKGSSKKLYFPDYVIHSGGLPLLIIEAKKPGEELLEAYKEARLYASELNAQYDESINPCHKIIVTNFKETICGFWDSDQNLIKFEHGQINTFSSNYMDFVEFCKKPTIFKFADKIQKAIRGNSNFSRPLSLIGGKPSQQEELEPNGFGSTISLEFRNLFNPLSTEDRKKIVHNAYVKVKRHIKQVDPIERIIRATIPISSKNLTDIEDSTNPKELNQTLLNRQHLKKQLLLLVGSVGSGKSTFTEYIKEIGISEEVKKNTVWLTIDLNLAPLNREEIYQWLRKRVIEELESEHPEMDFSTNEIKKRVFSTEVNSFYRGPASVLGENSDLFKQKYVELMFKLDEDLELKSKAYTRHLCSERGKLLIVVLDNCDRRELKDQLLMFDVANWMKDNLQCLVILPLRDTTYDNHRKEPPLDTVIKDLVFRIHPPLLKEVIYERVRYAFREMGKGKRLHHFTLQNEMVVEYPHSDQGYYLACILKSLFDNIYFSRLITGIAGRDIRKGLEVFLDFCKSGHIDSNEIYRIMHTKGVHTLPNYMISNVFIRGNLKYYNDNVATVKNLFDSDPREEKLPNPLTRLAILKWLYGNLRREGPNKAIGYHKVTDMFRDLIAAGFLDDRLTHQLKELIKFKLVITESQTEDGFDYNDLISIGSSGIIHLELLNDLNYLSGCSEDIWYKDADLAQTIAKRITNKLGKGHYSKETALENSQDLVGYLGSYKDDFLLLKPEFYLDDAEVEDYIEFDKLQAMINKAKQRESKKGTAAKWEAQYPSGTKVDAEISYVKPYGVFVEFGLKAAGFISINNIRDHKIKAEELDLGEKIKAEIIEYNEEHNRFTLKFVSREEP